MKNSEILTESPEKFGTIHFIYSKNCFPYWNDLHGCACPTYIYDYFPYFSFTFCFAYLFVVKNEIYNLSLIQVHVKKLNQRAVLSKY